MLASPFAFYRGAAAVMAADLAAGPSSGINVQLCGDAHVANFGLFASAERRLVFDLNDFDETWPGPFEWDVKRLAASLEIAGRANGLSRKRRATLVRSTVGAHRHSMIDFAGQPTLTVWYARAELQPGLPNLKKLLPKAARSATRKVVAKASSRDHARALTKVTEVYDGAPRFRSRPPIMVPIRDLPGHPATELETWLEGLLELYRESLPSSERRVLLGSFRLVDMARRAVGVGSVGTRAWLLLLLDDAGEPLLLQAKEAVASVLAAHLPGPTVDHQGRRAV